MWRYPQVEEFRVKPPGNVAATLPDSFIALTLDVVTDVALTEVEQEPLPFATACSPAAGLGPLIVVEDVTLTLIYPPPEQLAI